MDPMHAADATNEGKLDLVPMIDCVMLLLLFFILTTKFSSEEKMLNSLLSTEQGQLGSLHIVVPPAEIHICLYPAGLERGLQPSDYLQRLGEIRRSAHGFDQVCIRIGRSAPTVIDLAQLHTKDQGGQTLERIHAYISTELTKFETNENRTHQAPVIIDCFSGLPWNCAITTYDAVRAYEQKHGAIATQDGMVRDDLEDARRVSFSPPLIRNSSLRELGEELDGIVNHL